MSEPVTVTWDGKDLAAVQMATASLPRKHGEPFATVEQGPGPFRLHLAGVPVPVGSVITITPDVAAIAVAPDNSWIVIIASDGTTLWEAPDGL